MAKKRRKVPKDKKTGVPKKYLSGLRGAKRSIDQGEEYQKNYSKLGQEHNGCKKKTFICKCTSYITQKS